MEKATTTSGHNRSIQNRSEQLWRKAFCEGPGSGGLSWSSVPFYSDNTRKLAMDVVADRGSDMKTVQYRQDVLQDLVSSERLLDSVQRIPAF